MKFFVLALIVLFSFATPLAVFAAKADFVVVVNGSTEVNREAYKFILRTLQANHLTYSIAVNLDPSKVVPGDYKSVVVLNTGASSGVDPVLEKFVAGYPNKKDIFLVNLFKGRADLTVVPLDATATPEGVDGVTAASSWAKGWGADNRAFEAMHVAWVNKLVKFLQRG